MNYTLWIHELSENSWALESYTKMLNITTPQIFWEVFNNITMYGPKVRHFYLMKEDILPMWEDKANRMGGVCSFRIESNKAIALFEYLCVLMICGELVNAPHLNTVGEEDNINGISFSPKTSWTIVKIWNSNRNNDISKLLNKDIIKKYPHISIQYKGNMPEY